MSKHSPRAALTVTTTAIAIAHSPWQAAVAADPTLRTAPPQPTTTPHQGRARPL